MDYGYKYDQYGSPVGGQDHGDPTDYYSMQPMSSKDLPSPPKPRHHRHQSRHSRSTSRSTHSKSRSKSRSSRSRSRSQSRSKSRSRSRSRTRSVQSRSVGRLNLRDPSFLDAFRVLYLTPSNTKKNTSKYLTTKKKQDCIEDTLKRDGLGSKRWLFYPRTSASRSEPNTGKVAGPRDNSDQRIKVDGQFFRKYKKSNYVPRDAPIAKLKRWELILYKKFGFVKAE